MLLTFLQFFFKIVSSSSIRISACFVFPRDCSQSLYYSTHAKEKVSEVIVNAVDEGVRKEGLGGGGVELSELNEQ